MSSSAGLCQRLGCRSVPSETETFRKIGTLSGGFAERLVGCGNPATGSSHRLDRQASERCGSRAEGLRRRGAAERRLEAPRGRRIGFHAMTGISWTDFL